MTTTETTDKLKKNKEGIQNKVQQEYTYVRNT
jgi:hypothetical protein